MDKSTALSLLYADLGYCAPAVPQPVADYAVLCLDAAERRLIRAGVRDPAADASLVDLWVMFAAYLYRHRNTEKPMPPSLRLALNDAKVDGATEEGAAV